MNIGQSTYTHANLLQQSTVKNAGQKHAKHQQHKQSVNSIFKETEKNIAYSVEISSGVKNKTEDTYNDLQKMANDLQGMKEQLNNISEQGQGSAEAARIRMICMKIAFRIIKGDKVPIEDHRYLQKHDPELYAEAISKKMPNIDPEEHDRLSEDDESDDSNTTDDSAFDIPAQIDNTEAE